MSFSDRFHSAIIGVGSGITAGTATAIEEEPIITDEGWDSLRITYVHRVASLSAETFAALYPIGTKLGSRNWWITGARPIQKTAGFWLAQVDLKGWAASKPAKVRVGSAAEQQTATNILAPRYEGDSVGGTFAKVETHENMPTISVSYLVADAAAGGVEMTSKVGTAQTPPVTIAVPDTVWDFLTEYVWHWPQEWVLMGSDQDRLSGTTAALVTDTYKYIRDKTPG